MIDTSTSLAQAKAQRFQPKPIVTGDPEASPEGEVFSPDALTGVGADLVIHMKEAADYLEKVYHGWMWAINPNPKGKVVNLFSMRLNNQYGFVIHADQFCNDYQRFYIKWAAGETLERFGMPRKPFLKCLQEYEAAKRDVQGRVIPDLAKVPKNKIRGINKEFVINEQIRTGELVEQSIQGHRFLVKTRNFHNAAK